MTMNMRTFLAAIPLGLALSGSLLAHRVEGLLQASLVEVLPTQVGVEVTLVPGIDISTQMFRLLDSNADGTLSPAESAEWSKHFMARQQVLMDGRPLPLKLENLRTSPLSELGDGHAEIVVHFTAEIGPLARGPHSIRCINRYEPLPTSYQSNGLVPKAPGVSIANHQRDARQQELILSATFLPGDARETPSPRGANEVPASWMGQGPALPWLLAFNVTAAALAGITELRRRAGKTRHQQMS